MSSVADTSDRHHALRRELPALAILVAAVAVQLMVVVVWDRTYFAAPDNTEQFFAWYQKFAAEIHSGSLPLWDANTLAGHSYVGETQTGVFYPLNLLWVGVFGSSDGIGPRRLDALVALHSLIGAFGFYGLVRVLGISRAAAVAVALVFAFTGPVAGRATGQTAIFFGLVWIPWMLLFAYRHAVGGRRRDAVLAGVFVGIPILAGHFQPTFHGAVAVVAVLLLVAPAGGRWSERSLPRRAFGLALVAGTALLVALPQLAYTIPYLARAYRFTSEPEPTGPGEKVEFSTFVNDFSGGPESLLSLVDPERFPVPDGNLLFLGLPALAVLCVGMVVLRSDVRVHLRGGLLSALAVIGVGGLLAMLGPWTVLPRILYELPVVAQVRELARYSILVHVALCTVLAVSLHHVIRSQDAWRVGRRGVLLGLASGLLLINGAFLLIDGGRSPSDRFAAQLLLAAAVVGGLALYGRLGPRVTSVLVTGAVAVGAVANATALPSTSSPLWPPTDYARTPTISFIEARCRGHRTLVLDDALPRNVADVFRGIRSQNGFGATLHVPYQDFNQAAGYGTPLQTRLLDIRCLVARTPQSVPGYRAAFTDAGTTVYVDPTTSALNTRGGRPVRATVLRDDDRHRVWRVAVSAPEQIIISGIDYPGWRLEVDGREQDHDSFRVGDEDVFPIARVPAGRHTISWSWSGWPR